MVAASRRSGASSSSIFTMRSTAVLAAIAPFLLAPLHRLAASISQRAEERCGAPAPGARLRLIGLDRREGGP
jgi:hypothetical protein